MKKHNLLKEESSVDPDAAKEFLQKWAEANPEWKEPMEKAIENCVGKQLPGPPQICEPNKMVFCLSSTLFGVSLSYETLYPYNKGTKVCDNYMLLTTAMHSFCAFRQFCHNYY